MGRHDLIRQDTQIYELFLIGEQIRCQMREQRYVKDRRHHLRKYKSCFVGKDTVDWLVRMCHVQTRHEAVAAMQVLKEIGLIHHVSDEFEFKDQNVFYRFTRDDDTYKVNRDLMCFYRGLDIYRSLKTTGKDVLRDLYHKGALCSDAFYGCDVIDFLQGLEDMQDRDPLIYEMRDLLEKGVIKHVTDEYPFNDDRLIFQFSIDFRRVYVLQDLFDIKADWDLTRKAAKAQVRTRSDRAIRDSFELYKGLEDSGSMPQYAEIDDDDDDDTDTDFEVIPYVGIGKQAIHSRRKNGVNTDTFEINSAATEKLDPKREAPPLSTTTTPGPTLSPAPRTAPLAANRKLEVVKTALQEPIITMVPDDVGFGFVLHGCSPCRVVRVDPWGPARAAGLKVDQCVTAINGQEVTRMSHKQIGQLVARCHCEGHELRLTLTSKPVGNRKSIYQRGFY